MTFEEELLIDLKYLIDSGEIVIEALSDKYFVQLGTLFPIFGSKIDWDEVPESIEEISSKEDYIGTCYSFFIRMYEQKNLKGQCILIGDNAMKCALIIPIGVLSKCLKRILEIPQHLYVIAEDYSWCFSFTMEGDMGFGMNPTKRLIVEG